jgi:hypothetical protein
LALTFAKLRVSVIPCSVVEAHASLRLADDAVGCGSMVAFAVSQQRAVIKIVPSQHTIRSHVHAPRNKPHVFIDHVSLLRAINCSTCAFCGCLHWVHSVYVRVCMKLCMCCCCCCYSSSTTSYSDML